MTIDEIISIFFTDSLAPWQGWVVKINMGAASTVAVILSIASILYFFMMVLLIDCKLVNQCKKIGICKKVSTKKRFASQPNRFLLYFQLGALSTGISNLYDLVDEFWDKSCIVAGFMTTFSDYTLLCWGFHIALFFFIEVFFLRKRLNACFCNSILFKEIVTEIFACSTYLIVTLFFATLPIFLGLYGDSGGWCWIRNDSVWFGITAFPQIVLYYFEVWMLLAFIIIAYLLIGVKSCCVFATVRALDTGNLGEVKKNRRTFARYFSTLFKDAAFSFFGATSDIQRKQTQTEIKTFWRLAFFPLYIMIVWSIPTMNRLTRVFTGKTFYPFVFIQSFLYSAHGFVSFFYLVFDPMAVMNLICCFPCRMLFLFLANDHVKKQKMAKKKGSFRKSKKLKNEDSAESPSEKFMEFMDGEISALDDIQDGDDVEDPSLAEDHVYAEFQDQRMNVGMPSNGFPRL